VVVPQLVPSASESARTQDGAQRIADRIEHQTYLIWGYAISTHPDSPVVNLLHPTRPPKPNSLGHVSSGSYGLRAKSTSGS
jgi:hypothetical protein